ncbi:hypothetical protein ABI260_09140 [Pseudomonas guguanensis]|uniref:hypothetical protein n=1 Tax=Ectopseudomonas guguanensis TaxID=1198456 RepID=UPI00326318F7
MSIPTFKSSLRLYGLFRDGTGEQAGQISCMHNLNGCNAIRAFVSRLDAEIAVRYCGVEGYQARLLSECFDPNAYLRDHQGWLSLHICCGFAAHSQHLLEAEQRLIPMGWLAQAHLGEWTSTHYLAWGQQLSQQLQACYDRVGLRNYNALLNEWDDVCAAEMRWHTDEALHAMPPRLSSQQKPSQFALFDAVECRWRFASSNMDVHESHTRIQPQGALS